MTLPIKKNAPKIGIAAAGSGGVATLKMAMDRFPLFGDGHVQIIFADTDEASLRDVPMGGGNIKIIKLDEEGRGTGSNPEKGKNLAIEKAEDFKRAFEDCDIILIIAATGGGTGAGFVIASQEIFKEIAPTICFAIRPFPWENRPLGESSLQEFLRAVKGLTILELGDLYKILENNPPMEFQEIMSCFYRAIMARVHVLLAIMLCESPFFNADLQDILSILEMGEENKEGQAELFFIGISDSSVVEENNPESIRPLIASIFRENFCLTPTLTGAVKVLANFSCPPQVKLNAVDIIQALPQELSRVTPATNAATKFSTISIPGDKNPNVAVLSKVLVGADLSLPRTSEQETEPKKKTPSTIIAGGNGETLASTVTSATTKKTSDELTETQRRIKQVRLEIEQAEEQKKKPAYPETIIDGITETPENSQKSGGSSNNPQTKRGLGRFIRRITVGDPSQVLAHK